MLHSLALLFLARGNDPITVTANESVWVYTHAGDPTGDKALRIWGVGGMATPEGKGEGEDWSYGYLSWDVSALPDKAPKSVTLTLYNNNPAGFGDAKSAADTPVEARGMVGAFVGKEWDYSKSVNIHPDLAKTVFGAGAPKPWGDSKDPIQITINMMKGPGDFKAYLAAAKASKSHLLQLALTSTIDPSTAEGGGGKGGVYKIFSATAEAKYRPMLTIDY